MCQALIKGPKPVNVKCLELIPNPSCRLATGGNRTHTKDSQNQKNPYQHQSATLHFNPNLRKIPFSERRCRH
jgi:hypothetical protein